MGRTMQISSSARAVGRKHHVIGTSMSSKKRMPGHRSSVLSQEEYSIFSPVLCPAVVSWVKDPDSAGQSVEDIVLNQSDIKDIMSYRSLNGETDFHDAETDFRDADSPGMWKEIHTDISTDTPELEQMHPHPLRPRSPNSFLERIKNPSSSATPDRTSPNESGHLDRSIVSSSNASVRAAMKSPLSTYMVPSTGASPDEFYAHERASTTNSPQHRSMWSPHRAATKSLSTLPLLDMPSPRAPKNFGWLTPNRQHTRAPEPRSPEFAKPPQRDLRMSPSHTPAVARESWSPPETVTKSPARPPSTTMKSKSQAKLQQQQQQQQQLQQLQQQEFVQQQNGNASPRHTALSFTTSKDSKPDKSPGKGWKNLSRSISPMFTGKKTEVGSALRGIGRDLGASFQGSKRRGPANASRSDGSVSSAPIANWSRCSGDSSMVAPELEKEPSGADSDRLSSELTRTGSAKSTKSGSNSMFSFMGWGRRKNHGSKANELFPSAEQGTVKLDSNSFKVMDYTIKTLQYKLEQAKKNELATANEFKALELAMHAVEGKCKELQQRCQELESELGKLKTETRDVEQDYESTKQQQHRRDNTATGLKGRFVAAALEVTPLLFQKAFDDAKLSIKKLASALCVHIRECGESATQVITALLEQHKDTGRCGVSKMPRNVIILYFESFLNQVLFESFENVSFEPSGMSPVFEPDALRTACCKAYHELRKQEWACIEKSLGKPGSTIVNPTFHRFFVLRMELILSQLTKVADKETSLALLTAFFNAFKSVWLLHHLAFAHELSPATIFRVPPASDFDPRFMEQVTALDEDPSRSKISVMVNPGFIVHRHTIKCQVFCSSKYQ